MIGQPVTKGSRGTQREVLPPLAGVDPRRPAGAATRVHCFQVRHEPFALAGTIARCCSPGRPRGTCFKAVATTLEQVTLSFSVTRDEEYVSIRLISARYELDLGARGHNYLLLVLARERLADAAQGLPDATCGWVYVDEVIRGVDVTEQQLNVDVFRVRRHFEAHGVVGGDGVIERRQCTRQLRIGTGRISILGA